MDWKRGFIGPSKLMVAEQGLSSVEVRSSQAQRWLLRCTHLAGLELSHGLKKLVPCCEPASSRTRVAFSESRSFKLYKRERNAFSA